MKLMKTKIMLCQNENVNTGPMKDQDDKFFM